eukprot:PLAT16127.1.p1 GENE.PLAT16127.1~~PLAT16127.1.p1  ORF type:complete len:565 (+),score=253.28 PLAT16127.1:387-2081(+)
MSEADVFGHSSSLSLGWPQLTASLRDEYEQRLPVDVPDLVSSLSKQLRTLPSVFSSWSLSSMRPSETRRLLSLVSQLQQQYHGTMKLLSVAAEREADLLATAAVRIVQSEASGRQSSPFAFQRSARAEIEAACHAARVRALILGDASARGKRRAKAVRDAMGHGTGGRFAVRTGLAFRADGEEPIEVVSIPRRGVPFPTLRLLHDCYEGHRQLQLSPRFPNACGRDDRGDGDACSLYYQFLPGRRAVAELLHDSGSVLVDSQPLFRHWARQLLCALAELSEQSTRTLLSPLGIHNVFVGDEGRTVQLGRLPFGAQLKESSLPPSFARRRERCLLRAFADMAAAMLSPSSVPSAAEGASAAAHADGAGGGRGGEAVAEYTARQARHGLRVQQGSQFVLLLDDMDAESGQVWQPPTIMGDKAHGATAAVTLLRPPTTEHGITELSLRARLVGRAVLLLYQKLPWEAMPARPTLRVEVTVLPTALSPTVSAILASCRPQRSKAAALPPPRLRELLLHPLFAHVAEEEAVRTEYAALCRRAAASRRAAAAADAEDILDDDDDGDEGDV